MPRNQISGMPVVSAAAVVIALASSGAVRAELIFVEGQREVSLPSFFSWPEPIKQAGFEPFHARLDASWGYAEQHSYLAGGSIFVRGTTDGNMGGINMFESCYSKVFVMFEVDEPTPFSLRGVHALDVKASGGISTTQAVIEGAGIGHYGAGEFDLRGTLAPGTYIYKHQSLMIGMEVAESTFDVRLMLPAPGFALWLAAGLAAGRRRR